MARTIQEKAIDRLFALYVVNRCRTKHGINGVSETKLHKLFFYSARKLNKKKNRAFNYKFIKLLYPTYSPDLRTDLNELAELGFLEGPYFKELRKSEMILEDFKKVFEQNKEIMHFIDSQVDRYAQVPTDKLVNRTKKMHWRNTTIGKLPNGTPLIYPLANPQCEFSISKEDLEDLAICLSPVVAAKMEESAEELRRGKRLTHAEVFRELC